MNPWWQAENYRRHNDKPLRILTGVLAMTLPGICWGLGALFDLALEPSVSHYYHTNARDYFEGILFLIGFFLLTYQGHQRIDAMITTVLGILLLAIGVFPCAVSDFLRDHRVPGTEIGIFRLSQGWSDHFHLGSAVSFFILLTVYVLVFFTKSDGRPTPAKRRRNVVYRVCGWGMLGLLVLVGVLMVLSNGNLSSSSTVMFFIESGLLVLFGISWLTKAGIVPGFRDLS